METNENDLAFPFQDNGSTMVPCLGLTKREYIAAMAMQGILAFGDNKESYATLEVPYWAVRVADALIKALNEKSENGN